MPEIISYHIEKKHSILDSILGRNQKKFSKNKIKVEINNPETFDGEKLKIGYLPCEDYTFCIEYNKTIARQKQQNDLYEKL